MNKLFSIAFGVVMAAVAIPVHAAIQYNMETFSGGSWFSVDEKQTVYLNVKNSEGADVALKDSVISNIGWYKYSEVVRTLIPGAPAPTLHTGDMKTGKLGEFSPEDKIVLWIETTNAKGEKETYSMFDPKDLKHDIWLKSNAGDNIILNWGDFVNIANSQKVANPAGFEFSITTTPPSGQPLPGIIATLLVSGGCGSLIYLRRRKKLKAAK
jgi:hypothetical protein